MFLGHPEPPFQLGDSYDGVDPDGNLTNDHLLGQIHTHRALGTVSTTAGATRARKQLTGRPIVAVILRNTSGAALLPGRLGQLSRTAGYKMTKEVDGYSTTLANQGVVVIDPYLPS